MQEKIARIHQNLMAMLEKVGIKLHHSEICSVLQEKGIKVNDRVAYFTEEQVMSWVGKVPGKFMVHARNPEHDALIGGGQPQYAGGYGCSAITDTAGNRRDATLSDLYHFLYIFLQIPVHIRRQLRRFIVCQNFFILSISRLHALRGSARLPGYKIISVG